MSLTLWSEDATQAIEELRLSYEQKLQTILGDDSEVEVDGSSFLSHGNFQAKSEDDRFKLVEGLFKSFMEAGLFADNEGLKPWLERSDRAQSRVSEEIQRVVLSFAADNTVSSEIGNSYYQIRVQDNRLEAKVRLDCIGYTDGWGPKLDKQLSLNINAELAQRKAEEIREEQQERLNSALGAELELTLDWGFMGSPEFKRLDDSARDKMILGLVQEVVETGLFKEQDGFVEWCRRSTRIQQHILNQVEVIRVSLEPSNRVEGRIGNDYYQLRLESSQLLVKVRMDCVGYTDGWGEKADLHLGCHWLEQSAMAECLRSLGPRIEEFNEAIGADLQCEINWGSFLDHDAFKEFDKAKRRATIVGLSEAIVQKGLFADGGLKAWCEKTARGRQCFLESIAVLRVELDPGNRVDSQAGNDYYQIRVDGSVLVVRVRMDCVDYTDGWGSKVDKQLGVNAVAELSIRAAEGRLGELNERLKSEAQLDLQVVVDWASYVNAEEDQSGKLEQIVDHVVEQGLFSANGAVHYFRAQPQAGEHVKYLVVKIERSNRVDSKVGNDYYQLRVVDGAVQVLVRADCIGYTDGWQEKLEFHSEAMMAASRAEGSPLESFAYLKEPTEFVAAAAGELLEPHPFLSEYDEFRTRELTPEELAQREERKRLAQERREAAERAAAEAEAARRAEAERQAEKLRAAQKKMQEALGQQRAVSDVAVEIDAEAPEVPGVEAIVEELKTQNSGWGQLFNIQTQYELDWSFKSHGFFLGLSESQRSEFLDVLRRRVIATALDRSSGLGGLVYADELYKNWAMAFAGRVVIAVDGDNSICSGVSSEYAEHYQLSLPSAGTLLIRINENKVKEGLYQLHDHARVLANVDNMIAMREVTEFANQQCQELSRATATVISAELDFDFIFSPEFLKQSGEERTIAEIKEQRETVKKLERVLTFIASASSSLAQRCGDDEVMKSAVAEKVSVIKVAIDARSQIDDRTLGDEYSKAYSLVLNAESRALEFVCNLNLLDAPYRFDKRFDEVIQVRVQQAQRDCLQALTELFKSRRGDLGRDIEYEIDWSFCEHEAFASKSLDEKETLIRKIDQRWFVELLSEHGLTSQDSDIQGAMRERIERLRFVIDPEEGINCAIGGSYAVHYQLRLVGKQLTVFYNLNDENNLYHLNEKFDELLDVRVAQAQRAVKDSLEQLTREFHGSVGKDIVVEVAWSSFTGHEAFLARDLADRGEITQLLVNKIARALFQESMGLTSLATGESSAKLIIQEELERVRLAIDCDDSINEPEDGEYATHYSVTLVDGLLECVINMGKIKEGLYRLDEKLDRVLHFETAKQLRIGREQVIPGLKAELMSGSLELELDFVVEADFTDSATWRSYKIAEKREAIQGLFGVLKILAEDAEKGLLAALDEESLLTLFRKHVETVVIAYDMEMAQDDVPGDWYYAEEYQLFMRDPSQLYVCLTSGVRRGQIYEFPRKLPAQLQFAEQRRVSYGRDWQFASQKCGEFLGSECRVFFAWESLESGEFLYHQSLESQRQRLKHLHRSQEGAVGGFKKLIKAVASNPASCEAFTEAIVEICFEVRADGDDFPMELNEGVLKFGLPMGRVDGAVPFKTWLMMTEWQLGSLIAANQFRARRRILKFQSSVAELLGKELPVTIDWAEFEEEGYLERGPEQIVRDFDLLSGALMKAVLIEGVGAVAEHPLGKRTVQEELDGVTIRYRREMSYTGWSEGRTDSQLEIIDRQLVISTDNLRGASECRYKPRIEFSLDLIVKIAAANSEPKREVVQASLCEALGQTIQLGVELDFSQRDEFKRLTPERQSDLVTLLASSWYEEVFNQDIGLRGLIRHELGASVFKDKVKAITLTAATTGESIAAEGVYEWRGQDKAIVLTVPFSPEMERLQSRRSYARLAECLNIDLEIMQAEAAEMLAGTQAEFNSVMSGEVLLVIDWAAWVKEPEWLSLGADDRLLYGHRLARGLKTVLLGYWGVAGPAEFGSVREAMREAFSQVRVTVAMNEEHDGRVRLESRDLVIELSLRQLITDTFRGLRLDVEEELQLKSLMEAAVRSEVEGELGCLDLGVSAELIFDWDQLAVQEEYQSESDFVALTRELGQLPGLALMGEEGLSWLASENETCGEKLKELSEIVFRVDLGDAVSPAQVRFVPMFYECGLDGQRLVVTMRRRPESERGCGMVLEFILDAREAERKEEAHIQRIADQRRRDEISRREREQARIVNANNSAQRDYASKVKRYNVTFKEYEKKKDRPHRPCDGTGRKTCGNMWHSGRSKMRKCHTCNGKGWIRCVGCSGTGKHYPRIKPPNKPIPPTPEDIPNWRPIEAIDWREGI